eukprot:SM000008S22282  [mRNA]  locus=s8:834878:836883:- [translate_table: standard]
MAPASDGAAGRREGPAADASERPQHLMDAMLAPDSPTFSDADLPFLEWDDSLAALDVAAAAAVLDAGGWDFDSEDVFGGGVLAVVEGAGETPPSLGPPCLEPISVSQAIGESNSSNSSGGVPWWNEVFEDACDSLEAEGCASSAPQPAAPLLRRSASRLTTGRCKRGWTQSKEGLSATVIPLQEQELRTTEQESLGGGEPASDQGSLDVQLVEAAAGRGCCATEMEPQVKPPVECQGPLLEGYDELRTCCDDDEDATAATKRQKRLVRNRESALQSRQRRKSYVRELEGRCALLERQLGHLQQCVSVTAAENHAMQLELLRLAHLRTGAFQKMAQPPPHAPHGAGQPSEKSSVIGDKPAEPAVLESDSLPPESLPAHCQSRTPRGALPSPCGAPPPLPYTWWQRLAGGPFPRWLCLLLALTSAVGELPRLDPISLAMKSSRRPLLAAAVSVNTWVPCLYRRCGKWRRKKRRRGSVIRRSLPKLWASQLESGASTILAA